MELSDLVYIDATGYHYADYPAFRQWLIDQYTAIYGDDVYLEDDSMDGQFLSVLAQAFYQTATLGAAVYNSFSPTTAQGVGLSRNVKINGLSRLSPSYSTAILTIVGAAGTVITNGIAADVLGQQWALPATVTIPGGGEIDVTATSVTVGFVNAQADTITTIFTPTRGWQTVTNDAAATPGEPVETDATLRLRQAVSTSLPAQTVLDATIGAVANVSGVTKVTGYENYTDLTDANLLPPHSIVIALVGGDSTEIAEAIMTKKTPGTNPEGNTGPINVTDARGLIVPINFTRAVTATIECTVNVTSTTGWSNDYVDSIKDAIAEAINAQPIGSIIYFSALFAPALLVGLPGNGTFSISSLTIGKNGGGQSAANIALDKGIDAENPVCVAGTDITVNVS
jgi:uncharacterized phage protein gp47/JayE